MLNKILFFGNERLGTGLTTNAPTLQALVTAGYQITGLVLAQNNSRPSRRKRTPEIVQVAAQHGIPILSPPNLSQAKDDFAAHKAEAGVLVAYGKIVPPEIIDLFPRGIINIHPSLLPLHRGPTPIENTILKAEKETGVTLMQLSAKMDAGPFYTQQVVPLRGNETKQLLAEQLLALGRDMLLEHLPRILDGSLAPLPQNDDIATYDELIKKSDGQMDLTKTAVQLEREVRAYAGWPRSRTLIGASEVIVTQAHVIETNGMAGELWLEGHQLGLHTHEGTLVIDSLIPDGKKEMPASAFLAGYKVDQD